MKQSDIWPRFSTAVAFDSPEFQAEQHSLYGESKIRIESSNDWLMSLYLVYFGPLNFENKAGQNISPVKRANIRGIINNSASN